jgi:hypothetical protein
MKLEIKDIALFVLSGIIVVLLLIVIFRKPDDSHVKYLVKQHNKQIEVLTNELDKTDNENAILLNLLTPSFRTIDSLNTIISNGSKKIKSKRKNLQDEKDTPIPIFSNTEHDSLFNVFLNGHN